MGNFATANRGDGQLRAVVQRVKNANVTVENSMIGKIGEGLVILLGVGSDDTCDDIKYLADKIINLRIFSDADDKMNLSVKDIDGQILVISQFTLYGDCRKGRRPSFDAAMMPYVAKDMYFQFIKYLEDAGMCVQCGEFGADMDVKLVNNGPVTMLLESKKLF